MDWTPEYRPLLQRLYDLCLAHGISTFLSPPRRFECEENVMRASSSANTINPLIFLITEYSALMCSFLSLVDAASVGRSGSQFAAVRPESRIPVHLRSSFSMLPCPLDQVLPRPPNFAKYYARFVATKQPLSPMPLVTEPIRNLQDYLISIRIATSAGGVVVAGLLVCFL
jgi:hypothetical protein